MRSATPRVLKSVPRFVVHAAACAVLGILAAGDAQAGGCGGSREGCSIFAPCCSDLLCDILLECRHVPGQGGERCGAGVPCGSGLVCSASIGGRCEACKTARQRCGVTGGGGTCCSGLVCDVIGECRHQPGQLGEPCGIGVPCADPLQCSATVGGRCEACKGAGESCGVLGGRCVHFPAEEGEICDLDGLGGAACGPGLTCQAGIPQICVLKKSIGEACFSTTNCLDGLECWPFYQQCFPEGGERLFDDEQCRSWYRPSVHQDAMDAGLAFSFGYGSAVSVVLGATYEIGIVYGPDGSYGCYLSTCTGIKSDVEIGSFACVGFSTSYDTFRGDSLMFVEEVGEGIVFSTSQSFSFEDPPVLIGTADCLSIELSLAPIAAGEYYCNTIVDTLIPEESSCGNGFVEQDEDCDDGTATFAAGDACTDRCLFTRCGGPTGVIAMRPSATDVLIVLRSAILLQTCAASVCDANGDGTIAASDALAVLAAVIGRPVAFNCPPPDA